MSEIFLSALTLRVVGISTNWVLFLATQQGEISITTHCRCDVIDKEFWAIFRGAAPRPARLPRADKSIAEISFVSVMRESSVKNAAEINCIDICGKWMLTFKSRHRLILSASYAPGKYTHATAQLELSAGDKKKKKLQPHPLLAVFLANFRSPASQPASHPADTLRWDKGARVHSLA